MWVIILSISSLLYLRPFSLDLLPMRTYQDRDPEANRIIFQKMIKSCLIAGGLLAGMYVGLTYLASFYTPVLPAHAPEERLATVSLYLLGPWGALFSCVAVALSCLTTAIPISIISSDISRRLLCEEREIQPSLLL